MSLKKDKAKIKLWEQELEKLQESIPEQKELISEKQRELSVMLSRERLLEERIKLGYLKQPTISDHAIVQYLTRVRGLNLEEMEKIILSDDVLTQLEILGPNGKFVTKDLQVVMKNNNVVTVYDPSTKKE